MRLTAGNRPAFFIEVSAVRTTSNTVSGERLNQLVQIAHAIAHEEGGCDERPVLYGALAFKELDDASGFLTQAEMQQAVTNFTAAVSFAAATFMENFIESIKERLPREVQEAHEKQRLTIN